MEYQAILLGAGSGTRANLGYNKVFYKVDNEPILLRGAKNFILDNRCTRLVVACKKEELEFVKKLFKGVSKAVFVIGGETRNESVKNALKFIDSEYVLIHDGARPNYSIKLLDRVLDGLNNHDAIIPALKVTDTIKKVDNGVIEDTVDRELLYFVQTPQGFKTSLIKKAHDLAHDNMYTDDAMLIEKLTDAKTYIVQGEKTNIKYTDKEDF